jgi:uncharacterized metal-binding protein
MNKRPELLCVSAVNSHSQCAAKKAESAEKIVAK